jgi:hypothetical protein
MISKDMLAVIAKHKDAIEMLGNDIGPLIKQASKLANENTHNESQDIRDRADATYDVFTNGMSFLGMISQLQHGISEMEQFLSTVETL